jgi:hypothetical protein
MYDSDIPKTDAGLLVYLEGGPADFPESERLRRVPDDGRTIKVPHGAGYMHFERVRDAAATGADAPIVYRWSMLTRIAE